MMSMLLLRLDASNILQVTCTFQNILFCGYFPGLTGTLQSYNYADLAQIQGQNYKNCIRAEEGYCCIQYDVVGYAIDAATCADAANRSVMGHISDSSSSSQSV